MPPSNRTSLTVGIGDIHGRFRRSFDWVESLEGALGKRADLVFAVGDIEAFADPGDHRRKAAKRTMPAEFAEFASGKRPIPRPLRFIGGNNEDFKSLHPIPDGGTLIEGIEYLGRAGFRHLGELKVAYLSGIYAPKHFDAPLLPPNDAAAWKQAGYFRRPEVERLEALEEVDLMLVHEWPKGLVRRPSVPFRQGEAPKAYRFPWIGNPIARSLVERLKPRWLWAGHSHVPFAAEVRHASGEVTHVACLDQAASPEEAVFWVEWQGRAPCRAGWGVTGRVDWELDRPWGPEATPRSSG